MLLIGIASHSHVFPMCRIEHPSYAWRISPSMNEDTRWELRFHPRNLDGKVHCKVFFLSGEKKSLISRHYCWHDFLMLFLGFGPCESNFIKKNYRWCGTICFLSYWLNTNADCSYASYFWSGSFLIPIILCVSYVPLSTPVVYPADLAFHESWMRIPFVY